MTTPFDRPPSWAADAIFYQVFAFPHNQRGRENIVSPIR